MIQRIKNALLLSSSLFFMLVPAVALPATASAAISDKICNGVNDINSSGSAASGGCSDTSVSGAEGTIGHLAQNIVNILSIIVGIVAVIMIVIGGFRYITSGGESGNVSSAKNTLIYAIVGLVVVALAQLVVRFVLSNLNDAGV